MSLFLVLYTKIAGRFIASDSFGNRYFESRFSQNKGKQRRWVIFSGHQEASKIPAQWHNWIHGNEFFAPQESQNMPQWVKCHQPNLTGTALQHHPQNTRAKTSRETIDYSPWKPQKNKHR
jgi:NADH:ubiquinone oxidoreductase subunit